MPGRRWKSVLRSFVPFLAVPSGTACRPESGAPARAVPYRSPAGPGTVQTADDPAAWDDPDPGIRRRARSDACARILREAEDSPGGLSPDSARDRLRMLETHLYRRGIDDPRVLRAMRDVPREEFVPPADRALAYADHPLPVGEGQTLSQPYIVAYMAQSLELKGDETVFEVGTGSGYHAAVLARLVKAVYTIEIVPPLGRRAAETLKRLGVKNVHVRIGDGYRGWPEAAPFDAVIVTCAPDHVPPPLVDQLRIGGRIVIPVDDGSGGQSLVRLTKSAKGAHREDLIPVRFVPMTGEAEKSSKFQVPRSK